MKNLISHDSIHRVEPTAKALSEQNAKVLSDQQDVQNHNKKLREQESQTIQQPLSSSASDKESREKSYNSRENKKKKWESNDRPSEKNHFMGGQLFDSEA